MFDDLLVELINKVYSHGILPATTGLLQIDTITSIEGETNSVNIQRLIEQDLLKTRLDKADCKSLIFPMVDSVHFFIVKLEIGVGIISVDILNSAKNYPIRIQRVEKGNRLIV